VRALVRLRESSASHSTWRSPLSATGHPEAAYEDAAPPNRNRHETPLEEPAFRNRPLVTGKFRSVGVFTHDTTTSSCLPAAVAP